MWTTGTWVKKTYTVVVQKLKDAQLLGAVKHGSVQYLKKERQTLIAHFFAHLFRANNLFHLLTNSSTVAMYIIVHHVIINPAEISSHYSTLCIT